MRSGAHSTETKAKAETDSSSRWLVGMTAKKYNDENPTLRRNREGWGTQKRPNPGLDTLIIWHTGFTLTFQVRTGCVACA